VDPDKLYLALQPVKPMSDTLFEAPPSWSKLMILLTYPGENGKNSLERAEFLALNSWGELFLETLPLDTHKDMGDRYGDIANRINNYRENNLRCYFFQLAKEHDPEAVFEIKQNLAAGPSAPDPDRNRPLLDRL